MGIIGLGYVGLQLALLYSEAKAQGFSATADYSQLAAMDAIIICVPTPLNEYHEPDLSFITDTTHPIASHLRAGARRTGEYDLRSLSSFSRAMFTQQ